MATTTNYGWTKPTVGGSDGTWGTELNTTLDDIDGDLDALDTAVMKLAGTQTVTGDKTFSGAVVVPNSTTGTHALNVTTGDARYVQASEAAIPVLHTETVLSTSTASVAFTSNFTSTDRKIIFHLIGVNPVVTADNFQLELSTNGGSTYAVTAKYASTMLNGDSTIADQGSGTGAADLEMATYIDDKGSQGNLCGEVILHQYQAGSYYTVIEWNLVYEASGTLSSRLTRAIGGARVTTGSQINAVRFSMAGGNMDAGVFRHLSVAGS